MGKARRISRDAKGNEAVCRQNRDRENKWRAVPEGQEQCRDRAPFRNEQRDEEREMEDDQPYGDGTGHPVQLDCPIETAEHRLDRRVARSGEDRECHERKSPEDGDLDRRAPRPELPLPGHLDLGADP